MTSDLGGFLTNIRVMSGFIVGGWLGLGWGWACWVDPVARGWPDTSIRIE